MKGKRHTPDHQHRKLIRHYNQPGQAHELTFSCYKGLPLLRDERRCVTLSRAVDVAIEKQGFELVAFVYMPEHVHLVVWPCAEHATISRLLSAIKRPCSYRIKKAMEANNDPILASLMIHERPGRTVFRFWQEGGGYDRNINNRKTLQTVIDYVHANPVRRGLCHSEGDWRWSSWRHYHDPRFDVDHDLPTVHGPPA